MPPSTQPSISQIISPSILEVRTPIASKYRASALLQQRPKQHPKTANLAKMCPHRHQHSQNTAPKITCPIAPYSHFLQNCPAPLPAPQTAPQTANPTASAPAPQLRVNLANHFPSLLEVRTPIALLPVAIHCCENVAYLSFMAHLLRIVRCSILLRTALFPFLSMDPLNFRRSSCQKQDASGWQFHGSFSYAAVPAFHLLNVNAVRWQCWPNVHAPCCMRH